MEIFYTEIFGKWLRRIREPRVKAAIVSRIERIEDGNFDDRKSVGGGVSEPRIDIGKGYRVYYTIRRRTAVVLLCGGDKSSQQRDVHRARQIAGQH